MRPLVQIERRRAKNRLVRSGNTPVAAVLQKLISPVMTFNGQGAAGRTIPTLAKQSTLKIEVPAEHWCRIRVSLGPKVFKTGECIDSVFLFSLTRGCPLDSVCKMFFRLRHLKRNKENNSVSLLFGLVTAVLIGLYIWLQGMPWNVFWWPVLGAIFVAALLLPLFVRIPAALLSAAVLGCLLIVILGLEMTLLIKNERARIPPVPVLTVATPFPTSDKPQSKLWFAHGAWWAWLPDGKGSSVWRRSDAGWKRQVVLDKWLKALPGRADVWPEPDRVRAVIVSATQLAIAGLKYDNRTGHYQPDGTPVIWRLANPEKLKEPIESATIAKDGNGTWWISYDYNNSIWVNYATDTSGTQWGNPIRIGGPIVTDDISIIFPAPGAIGVMWAHQSGKAEEQVFFRRHLDAKPPTEWEDVQVIARGFEAAEDHFNAAVSPAGEVFVVTKDDKNIVGQSQLVLRKLNTDGRWQSIPYATRTNAVMPTRPIALMGGDPLKLYLVHSLYPQNTASRQDFVSYRSTKLSLDDIHHDDTVLIPQRPKTNIRNATSTKQILPDGAPWIVLASDKQGHVYEGVIEPSRQ